ncbi:MAG TPA: crosslink repair DNA glycosylase YcaQ family protein [Acidimicrobiales bacterium]|nr:crosslink repair DNA glycosylase YcaQ family protein [Acidimicrobiales bacterium]
MGQPSLGSLHLLAPAHRAGSPEAVADALVALHATDPASVHLAVAARTAGAGAPVADVDRALHVDRSIVRVMGMRRTMWAVPAGLVAVVVAACGRAVGVAERRKLVAMVEAQGLAGDGGRLVAELEERALAALAARGDASVTELAEDEPELRRTIRVGGDSKWAADVNLASRVVLLLTCDGRVVRSRRRGGWTSMLHSYAVAPPADPIDTADARRELARRWLAAFGLLSADPEADLRWWAGWTVAATREALAGAERPDPPPAGEPWAALLPGLDSTTMGWKERSWYLGDLGPLLFDRNGNAGPAVWWAGRVVGGWTQRPDGEVVTRLLVDVGREGEAAVEAEAERLATWLAASGAVVKPRFPTPLLRELAS